MEIMTNNTVDPVPEISYEEFASQLKKKKNKPDPYNYASVIVISCEMKELS